MRLRPAVTWNVASRRTFGVMPGRAGMRAARARGVRWLGVARARLRLGIEVVTAHLEAHIFRFRLRRYVWALERRRTHYLQALGEAVHEGRTTDAEQVKLHLRQLDEAIHRAQADLGRIDEHTHERIRLAKQEEGATAVGEQAPVPVPEPGPVPSPPPGPPTPVPEPSPIPSDPPGPVVVPEPEPPRTI